MNKEMEIPDWWSKMPRMKEMRTWPPAVTDHLKFVYAEIQHEKCTQEFIKRCIPHAAKYDSQWRKFPVDMFDPDVYTAHRAMADIITEEFERLEEEYRTNHPKVEESAQQEKDSVEDGDADYDKNREPRQAK